MVLFTNNVKCFKSSHQGVTTGTVRRTLEFQQRTGAISVAEIVPPEEPTEDDPEDKEYTLQTTEATAQENTDEMETCIWCPELRPSEAPIEPLQKSIGGSINSRSLVETRPETAPRSMRQWVKGRSDLILLNTTFTEWKKKKHQLALRVVVRDGRYILRLNEHSESSIFF
ncbi:uncharacterized protein LOC125940006 [Dermacentor silvarum]|uniref:uncharacterized protein LOC125940006 n=1 Tax=Dermacentor silvarum TaxID=543639 RepID=UPI002100F9CD|nr:uncharacterized protein LOC125940006 [Dermacentor silvarum]